MNELNSIMKIHLGEDYFSFPPLLQHVHNGSTRLKGRVEVRAGNFLARLICRIFKLPPQSQNCKLTVDCRYNRDSMSWIRNFDGLIMESSFHLRDGDLIENLGPLSLATKAVVEGNRLVYKFMGTKLFGIPLPNIFSPNILAYEEERDGRYHFKVEVKMPLVGFVIAYGGELEVTKF